ncbi:PadR family transcriptional regulator [Cryobacterium zhongshanensis]|uniref:PadR family transcriptional regulator n=1 Tax=Cryobacterium zhongshanensis TaxID=2928153 RepID=A0AA41QYH0_9MICO|nr:PadR family transcriptional regulator [Cryobacterium zhongshanensis]MCI4658261.1 PadR family transcriptional regulator [Cryobacterium zhongshanensis]
MSSIRLFILGSLAERGPMHGHQLRLLAEEEHVHMWTDISVGAVYGAIKRLATEGLIHVARVERAGRYPERQVYEISDAGRRDLAALRLDGLRTIVLKPDPFDLAMTRLDPELLDELPRMIEARLLALRALLTDSEATTAHALPYLTASEAFVMQHKAARLRAEIAWHEHLVTVLPDIVADELARKAD